MDLAELNAQLPRKVRLDSNSIGALSAAILILLIGLGVLVWLSLDTARNLRIQRALLQKGKLVNATIMSSSVNRGGTNVKYTFTVESALYFGYAEMKSDNFSVSGDPRLISILYLPTDPRINQPVNWKWASAWDIFPFLLLITLTVAGASVVIAALRLYNLARNGLIVVGKVTGCAQQRRLFTVFYAFTSMTGEDIEGSCNLVEAYDAGATISIIYLRNNPKRNSTYPLSGLNIITK